MGEVTIGFLVVAVGMLIVILLVVLEVNQQ
jgi:hypothetical protein